MKIIATYPTVLAAVEANITKFEYNPASARQSAKYSDNGFGRDPGAQEVWLLDDGNIWFVYQTKDGLRLLNKVSFSGGIDNSPFAVIKIDLEAQEISDTGIRISKSHRKQAAVFCDGGKTETTVFVLGSIYDRL